MRYSKLAVAIVLAVCPIAVCAGAPPPTAQTPDELAAACRREAGRFDPVTTAKVAEARERFRARLGAFHRVLTAPGTNDAYWPDYLRWIDTLQLLNAKIASSDAERIAGRWQIGATVWRAPELADVAEAIQSYLAALRANQANESAEQHAAAWNQLADLIAAAKQNDQAALNRLAEAVVQRERLGEATSLTRAIRQSLATPDIMFRASADWLQAQIGAGVDEPYQINGVYSSMSTTGAGRLTGATSCQLTRSPDAVRWVVWFQGVSTAATAASGNGATVNSRANTNLVAKQLFRLDAAGLAAEPSGAAGATAIQFGQIATQGRARRQQVAADMVNAGRGAVERDTAAAASRGLEQQMDKAAAAVVKRFNESYLANFRDPFTQADQLPPVGEFYCDDSVMYGDWHWPQSRTFAAPSPPFHSPTGMAVAIDAATIERFLAANVGGKRLSDEQFGQLVAPQEQRSTDASEQPSDRWLRLADQPCDVELANGRMSLCFHVAEFESAGVSYPPMTAAVVYKCQADGGRLTLARDGGFRTHLVADDALTGASGRQQTLQVALRRFFNRAMPEQIAWPSRQNLPNRPSLPIENLQVKDVYVAQGWLQLSLATAGAGKK